MPHRVSHNQHRQQKVSQNPWMVGLLSAVLALLLLLIAGVGFVAWWGYGVVASVSDHIDRLQTQTIKPIRDQAERLGKLLKSFWPESEVTIHDDGRIDVSSEKTSHLVTYIHQFQDQLRYKDRFMGSSKKVEVRGEFRALFGFDIKKSGLKIQYAPDGKTLLCEGLKPEVLAVELIPDSLQVKTDNGWINRVSDEDITHAGRLLLQQARRGMENDVELQKMAVESFLNYLRSVTPDTSIKLH